MSRLHKFALLSKEAVADSPSRRDGVVAKMEDRRRKMTATHLKNVAFDLKM